MTAIPKISALYESSLASALSSSGTSLTVVSGKDRDGNALSGLYGFIIDEGSADEEFIVGTISGTTITVVYRGLDADTPTTEVSGNKKAHRRGAVIKITDYPIIGYLRELANGNFTFPNKLKYESQPSFSSDLELVSKYYVDNLAVNQSGVPVATSTTFGTSKLSTAAADPLNPITVGDNDPRVPTQDENDAMAGTGGTVDASNPFATKNGSVENIQVKLSEVSSSGIAAGEAVFLSSGQVQKGFSVDNIAFTSKTDTTVASAQGVGICRLAKNRFVQAVGNSGTSVHFRTGFVRNGSFVWGPFSSISIGTDAVYDVKVVRLSDTSFAAAWGQYTGAIYVAAGTVSGTQVTMGSSNSITGSKSTPTSGDVAITPLSSSKFLVAYVGASTAYKGIARIITVSGTTCTLRTAYDFDAASSSFIDCATIDTDKFVITWINASGTQSIVGTANASHVISFGSALLVNGAADTAAACAALGTDKFIVAYANASISGRAYVKVGTVSGTTITLGSAAVMITESSFNWLSIDKFGASAFVISGSTTGNIKPYSFGTVSGTTVTAGMTTTATHRIPESYSQKQLQVIAVNNTIYHISVTASGTASVYAGEIIPTQTFAGIAKTAPSGGIVPVVKKGRSTAVLSGLTSGSYYYANEDGSLATTGIIPVGEAISTTEILID